MARNAPAQQKEGNLPLTRRFSLRVSECRSNPRPWTGGVPVPPGIWERTPSIPRKPSDIPASSPPGPPQWRTSRRAGNTICCPPAPHTMEPPGKKYGVSSPHTLSGTGPRIRVREYPLQKTSNFCPEYPAVPKGAFSVPLGKG